MKDDLKDDSAASVIQAVIRYGIERIELRDEIICQLIRQTTETPDDSSLVQGWLFLCLCTASFAPSKTLHKVLCLIACPIILYLITVFPDHRQTGLPAISRQL